MVRKSNDKCPYKRHARNRHTKKEADMTTEAEVGVMSHKSRNSGKYQKLKEMEYSHPNTLVSDLWPSEV